MLDGLDGPAGDTLAALGRDGDGNGDATADCRCRATPTGDAPVDGDHFASGGNP